MKYLINILAILLLTSCSSVDSGSCNDYVDCKAKAEQGYAEAQSNLGWVYENGKGVPQDYKEALKWYRKAAEQGDAKAQSGLGAMYFNGNGVPYNYKEAVKWYRKAAEQGDAGAQFKLGSMYAYGQGVSRDNVMAHMFINIAVANGASYAIEVRDAAARSMTPSQIEKAQDLAREWMRTH